MPAGRTDEQMASVSPERPKWKMTHWLRSRFLPHEAAKQPTITDAEFIADLGRRFPDRQLPAERTAELFAGFPAERLQAAGLGETHLRTLAYCVQVMAEDQIRRRNFNEPLNELMNRFAKNMLERRLRVIESEQANP